MTSESFITEPNDPPVRGGDGLGDGQRYAEFVREYSRSYHRLHSFVLTLVGDIHQADDLMQETGILLWQKFDDFAPGTDFLRWARAFARNLVRNFHRSRKQQNVHFNDELTAKLAATHTAAEEWLQTRQTALVSCVEKLSLAEQKLLRLCYAEHASIKAAAADLKQTQNAVSKRLGRIRIKLSRCVERTLGLAERR